MSDEGETIVAAVQEEAPPAPTPEPEPAAEPVEEALPAKSVSFENTSLTFDEAQQEIDSIKARASEARQSLTTPSSSYTPSSYSSSSSVSHSDDLPKSKNMLSHLNTESAMLNYKVQTARSLVRKQEDLLRNLARMRENMERSEVELGKASDYYGSAMRFPRRNIQQRQASAPRRLERESSPLLLEVPDLSAEYHSGAGSSTHSPLVQHRPPIVVSPRYQSSPVEYGQDEDFESEMATLRKRVSELSRKATDVTTTAGKDYGYYDTSSYLRGYGSDHGAEVIYLPTRAVPTSAPKYLPTSYASADPLTSSYSNYVLRSLDEYPAAVHMPSPQRDLSYYPTCSPLYYDDYGNAY